MIRHTAFIAKGSYSQIESAMLDFLQKSRLLTGVLSHIRFSNIYYSIHGYTTPLLSSALRRIKDALSQDHEGLFDAPIAFYLLDTNNVA